MQRRLARRIVLLGLAVALCVPSTAASAAPPERWSDRRLAAQVIFGCADSRDTTSQRAMAAAGVGGIVLLGSAPPTDLRQRLRSVRAASWGRAPMIASDEEGGSVQRLGPLLGRLPSAEAMGGWSRAELRRTARSYGTGMARLGVRMSLAPVADLRVAGTYIDTLGRAFGSQPRSVGRAVAAWSDGLRDARVAPVVKHWPGHGHARDTHQYAATVPPLAQLEKADLRPFRRAVRSGVPVVMVGHLQSAGLTPRGVPATQSRSAIRYLRRSVGPGPVIVTDSLSMAAATSARGLSVPRAVVASLRAGVDWAMVCTNDMPVVISAVERAMRDGRIGRARVVRSVERIVALKREYRR